ncbi:MAG TPA: hypothetical protein VGL98_09600 [Gammaproteobacteria bacterium]
MPRLLLPVIALTLLTSTNAWADLKTYDVDPQYQQEIFSALRSVLEPQGQLPQGRVQLLPSGQILVNADAETLKQVDEVLQAIRTKSVAATPRVALRYWGIFAAPAKSPATTSVGSPPPGVLNDVLSELKRLHGDVTFRVIGTAAVTTTSGQYGEVKGTTLSIEQTAYVQGDTLNANISMELTGQLSSAPQGPIVTVPFGNGNVPFGNLRLSTTLKRGEFVVLGENHVRAGEIDGPVFFIVHWEE